MIRTDALLCTKTVLFSTASHSCNESSESLKVIRYFYHHTIRNFWGKTELTCCFLRVHSILFCIGNGFVWSRNKVCGVYEKSSVFLCVNGTHFAATIIQAVTRILLSYLCKIIFSWSNEFISSEKNGGFISVKSEVLWSRTPLSCIHGTSRLPFFKAFCCSYCIKAFLVL